MTNKHCDACGDPLFRYDGQEFCPSCEGGTDAGDGARAEGVEETTPASNAERREDAANARARGGGEAPAPEGGAGAGNDASAPSGETAETEAATNADETRTATDATGSDRRSAATGAGTPPSGGASAEPAFETESAPTPAPDAEAEADLSAARASLVRTANRYARAAEAADDPRRARSYLAAVREAAEALDALDR